MSHQTPRIKICGITCVKDALHAARCGADALGFVFYPPSPRAVTAEQAQEIVQELPPFITTVGLFVNATVSEVKQTLATVKLDRLQFHGDETLSDCEQFGIPYVKALRIAPDSDIHNAIATYPSASAVLLDTYVKGTFGGTGQTFDWQQIPQDLSKPIILAGGLDASNVQQAIRSCHPYAVDVSGGVESAQKGIKDAARVAAFIHEVSACL